MTAHEHVAALRGAGRTVRFAEARIEVDRHVDRAALGGQATDEKGGRQEATRELGHHAFGQRESPAGGVPGGFERRGAGPVSTTRQPRGPGGTGAERARRGSADEPAEQRVAVEAGAHIQSIAPSEETSAAVRVSPMSP